MVIRPSDFNKIIGNPDFFFKWNLSCFSGGLNLWKHCIFPKKAFLWAKAATVDLSPIHTQHFLPHPELKLLPVSGQPFPLPPPLQKQPTQQRVVHRPSLTQHSGDLQKQLLLHSLNSKDYSSYHTLTLEIVQCVLSLFLHGRVGTVSNNTCHNLLGILCAKHSDDALHMASVILSTNAKWILFPLYK